MDKGIFHFIWRYSARDQLILILLSVLALPVLYFTFDLPKTIVNRAIGGEGGFPKEVLGYDLEQIPRCGWTRQRRLPGSSHAPS